MVERKSIIILTGFVLSVSLLASSFTALLLSQHYNRVHIQALGRICQEVIGSLGSSAEAEQAVMAAVKGYSYHAATEESENILLSYGYRQNDFLKSENVQVGLFILAGFMTGAALFFFAFFFRYRWENERIGDLTDYLEKVNTGDSGLLLGNREDKFSRLQDEIYKTVTELYQTRDEAVRARNNFAQNLYNIAHQIKTPITSMSLSLQIVYRDIAVERCGQAADTSSEQSAGEPFRWEISKHLDQIRQQLAHLTHLEESLLLLSRIDAGTLSLEKKETDVFTLLVLSADNLQELFQKAGVAVEIPELGETAIQADMGWTMEAVMNLLKNCMEHTPSGGTVRCTYEQNPLYTQIRIWDSGNGFAKEDIPHLFERFYRGKNARNGGIGIGLALSREIIERQNGTVSARNLPEGGACFEIRFYAH